MQENKELGYALKEIFSDEETREKLLEIKKDIIKEFINRTKESNPSIKDEKFNEHLENYLINDGSIEDVFQDIFRGCRLSILLPESIDKLKQVKEKISSMQKIPTSEELSILKSEILNIFPETQEYITTNPNTEIQETSESQETGAETSESNHSGTFQGTSGQIENLSEITNLENKFIKSVYEKAHQQIGKRYKRGGNSPNSGFDCSGLRYWAFKEECIKFSQRLTAHSFSDADVDITKDQVKPGDFMFWDKKPGSRSRHSKIYHIEMAISEPYTKNGKTYIKTLGSSTDSKDDCGNYVGRGVQIREREMKSYRHYGRPTYYYQLAQNEITGSNKDLIATANKPSQDLTNKILSA